MHFTKSVNTDIITHQSIQEFFFDSVSSAVRNQHIDTSDDTINYLVNLLTTFSRSEALFEYTGEGVSLKPLALMYGDALPESSSLEGLRIMQKLGDTALFISGVFPDSLNRKLIDVDYYIAMGGNAYSFLSDKLRRHFKLSSSSSIFEELTRRFVDFVDVLGEVSEHLSLSSQHDIMRLYEIWLRTGSQRTKARLRKLGIDPVTQSTTAFAH